MNPFSRALEVLRSVAWVEGQEPPFDVSGIEFSPVAAEAWRRCCDVVAELPIGKNFMSISRRLQLRFDRAESKIVSAGTAGVVWRWQNPPVGPWVTDPELAELQGMAAMWELDAERVAIGVDDWHPETKTAAELGILWSKKAGRQTHPLHKNTVTYKIKKEIENGRIQREGVRGPFRVRSDLWEWFQT